MSNMPPPDAPPVAAAIAAVVSAYRDCENLFHRVKKKRVDSNWPGPSKLLEESIKLADQEIRGQQKLAVDRLGDAFLVGDTIASETLAAILQDLRVKLLKHLFLAIEDETLSVGAPSCEISNDARIRTLVAMADLCERLSGKQRTPERRASLFRRRASSNAPEVVPAEWTSNVMPAEAKGLQRSASSSSSHRSPSPENCDSPSYLPQLSWFKRKSKIKRTGSKFMDSPVISEVEEDNEYFPSPSPVPAFEQSSPQPPFRTRSSSSGRYFQTGSSGPSPPLSDTYPSVDMDKTFSHGSQSEGTNTSFSYDSGCGTLSSLNSSNGAWHHDSVMTQTPTRPPGMQSTLLRLPKPENNFLGFCKGAVAFQRGDDKAFKEQQEMAFGKVTYIMCAHCAFTGRVSPTKVWEAEGLRYRWAFTAKAHVHQKRVKDNVHAYLCMFCVLLGRETAVMQGSDAFLRHTATHRGEHFTEAMLERVRCINSHVADSNEDFDINLCPVQEGQVVKRQSAVLPDSLMDHQPVPLQPIFEAPGCSTFKPNIRQFSWQSPLP